MSAVASVLAGRSSAVVDRWGVVEFGSHSELANERGVYSGALVPVLGLGDDFKSCVGEWAACMLVAVVPPEGDWETVEPRLVRVVVDRLVGPGPVELCRVAIVDWLAGSPRSHMVVQTGHRTPHADTSSPLRCWNGSNAWFRHHDRLRSLQWLAWSSTHEDVETGSVVLGNPVLPLVLRLGRGVSTVTTTGAVVAVVVCSGCNVVDLYLVYDVVEEYLVASAGKSLQLSLQ